MAAAVPGLARLQIEVWVYIALRNNFHLGLSYGPGRGLLDVLGAHRIPWY